MDANIKSIRDINFKNDLDYLKGEVIALQRNGNVCKYSRVLKCITSTNMSVEKYYSYWVDRYKPSTKNKDKEYLEDCRVKMETIKNIIDEKFKNIMSLEDMVELERNSKDTEDEKKKIIKEITSAK